MLTKRGLIRAGFAGAAAGVFTGEARSQFLRPSIFADRASLRELATRRHMYYGCATNTFELKDADFIAVLSREANMLVAEYEMKRGVIEAAHGQFDFSAGDALLSFAQKHGMAFRGHTLIWHKRNPAWLEDALANFANQKHLTGYIESVAGHYKGHMHSWDVVNEAIRPEDGRADGLRNTMWLKAFGPSYIDVAFHAARAADPKALLVYNDQGCEAGAPENDRFRQATLAFLERALARNVPIDALGLQGHLQAYGTQVDQKKLQAFLAEVKSLGLRILVTEHDVDDAGGPPDTAARDAAAAQASRRFLEIMLANNATVAVLTWGLSDRYLDGGGLFARKPRALPLDAEMHAKPMWQAMASAFAQA